MDSSLENLLLDLPPKPPQKRNWVGSSIAPFAGNNIFVSFHCPGNDSNGIIAPEGDKSKYFVQVLHDKVLVPMPVSSRQKETSSTTGMRETVETSTLLQQRVKVIAPSRILQMEEAIRNRDFKSFAQLTCADGNQFHAVCLDTSHRCNFGKLLHIRIINLVERWNRSEGTHQVAYTFDAGPNAVMIAPNRKVTSLLLQRLLFYFPPHAYTALASYVLGDQSIMHEAGMQSLKDVENLQPSPEIKDKEGSDEDDEEDDEE